MATQLIFSVNAASSLSGTDWVLMGIVAGMNAETTFHRLTAPVIEPEARCVPSGVKAKSFA
jgi:hypothetical protein